MGDIIVRKWFGKIALSLILMLTMVFGGTVNQTLTTENEKLEFSIISLKAASTTIDWPGSSATNFIDKSAMFSEDSSGLDFHNNQLYVVENGAGTLWVLDVAKNGTLTFANGFKDGKKVKFKSNPSSSKPVDTEGVTVDGDGWVYVSTERDEAKKSTPNNSIIKLDVKSSGSTLVGVEEWNLTSSLPKSDDSNAGLEAVEWVSNSELEGKLYDSNKKGLFDSSNYPKQSAKGVFFVGLEFNGHVYAYILNTDGTYVQIADIDAGYKDGVMALDYDVSQDVLWIVTDNTGKNMSTQVVFNGSQTPAMTNVKPVSTLNTKGNYEGFAIAPDDYAVNGEKPVWNLEDGVKENSLLAGTIRVDYMTAGGNGGNGGNGSSGGNSSNSSSGNSSNSNAGNSVNNNSSAGNSSNAGNSVGNGGGANHTHSYSQNWQFDSTQHYHGCQCGQRKDAENHTLITVNEKSATETEFGYTGDKVCTVCNNTIEKGKTIGKLVNGNNPVTGGQGCSASVNPISYVGGFAVLVLAMLFLVKKQKQN